MIAVDRDALICDMAETYGILDMYSVPVPLLATLAAGLGENSRIKKKILHRAHPEEPDVSVDTLLLARIVDTLSAMIWGMTKDAKTGENKPDSVLDIVTGRKSEKKANSKLQAFETPAAFLDAWNRMGGG